MPDYNRILANALLDLAADLHRLAALLTEHADRQTAENAWCAEPTTQIAIDSAKRVEQILIKDGVIPMRSL